MGAQHSGKFDILSVQSLFLFQFSLKISWLLVTIPTTIVLSKGERVVHVYVVQMELLVDTTRVSHTTITLQKCQTTLRKTSKVSWILIFN